MLEDAKFEASRGDRLRLADRAAARAERDGNVGGLVSAGRLKTAVLEHQRKAAPPPAVVHDDMPDMRAAAESFKAGMRAGLERIAAEIAALGKATP